MTPPRARQNCLHAQRRPRRAHGDNLHPCRRKSVATAAFRRSPARLNHRHVPGNHSVARTLAPQRHAPASQRHAGVQLRPRGGHLGPPSQPARQRRPCRSSWAGAQPARPTVVGALLTPCDQGRHDGCPHRLGGRQEGRVTLKLGSPRVRVAARRGCAVWRDHDDESAHHSTVCDRSRFIEVMSGARLCCAYLNAEESPGRGARRWRAGSPSGPPPAPPSPPPGGRSSPAGPTAARGRPSGAG